MSAHKVISVSFTRSGRAAGFAAKATQCSACPKQTVNESHVWHINETVDANYSRLQLLGDYLLAVAVLESRVIVERVILCLWTL